MCLLPIPGARADIVSLPAPGTMVPLSPAVDLPVLKGIKVHPNDPMQLDFVLDQQTKTKVIGDAEAKKLVKYFLASLTTPEQEMWVNLSPYEKDRIVPESFGQTEMGRDLLAQDYLLKQITASLVYPEGDIGKQFWKRVYELSGNKNVPVNTFNKVWIVPDKAVIYENAKSGTAYVVESSLKVMTEQDYLATSKHEATGPAAASPVSSSRHPSPGGVADEKTTFPLALRSKQADAASPVAGVSQIVRAIVIPQLTKEVNTGANFAQLRQVYNSLILATWYKKKIKDSILSKIYADKSKVRGTEYLDNTNAASIYQRYLEAFKKGAYNYIKEEQDPSTGQTIPRKYFSGGVTMLTISQAMVASNKEPGDTKDLMRISVQLQQADQAQRAKETKPRIRRSNSEVAALKSRMKDLLDRGKYSARQLAAALDIPVKTAENYVFLTDFLSEHPNLLKVREDRPQEEIDADIEKVRGALRNGTRTVRQIADETGLSVSLIWTYIKTHKDLENNPNIKREKVIVMRSKEQISIDRKKIRGVVESKPVTLNEIVSITGIRRSIVEDDVHAMGLDKHSNFRFIHNNKSQIRSVSESGRIIKSDGENDQQLNSDRAQVVYDIEGIIKQFLDHSNFISYSKDDGLMINDQPMQLLRRVGSNDIFQYGNYEIWIINNKAFNPEDFRNSFNILSGSYAIPKIHFADRWQNMGVVIMDRIVGYSLGDTRNATDYFSEVLDKTYFFVELMRWIVNNNFDVPREAIKSGYFLFGRNANFPASFPKIWFTPAVPIQRKSEMSYASRIALFAHAILDDGDFINGVDVIRVLEYLKSKLSKEESDAISKSVANKGIVLPTPWRFEVLDRFQRTRFTRLADVIPGRDREFLSKNNLDFIGSAWEAKIDRTKGLTYGLQIGIEQEYDIQSEQTRIIYEIFQELIAQRKDKERSIVISQVGLGVSLVETAGIIRTLSAAFFAQGISPNDQKEWTITIVGVDVEARDYVSELKIKSSMQTFFNLHIIFAQADALVEGDIKRLEQFGRPDISFNRYVHRGNEYLNQGFFSLNKNYTSVINAYLCIRNILQNSNQGGYLVLEPVSVLPYLKIPGTLVNEQYPQAGVYRVQDPYALTLEGLEGFLAAQKSAIDYAMKGGIDLNPSAIDMGIKASGQGINMTFDQKMLEQLQNAAGFVPVIINIAPIPSLKTFLNS